MGNWEESIVRILTSHKEVIGAGLLVDDSHIVTCAHVIVESWKGLSYEEKTELKADIYLDFPLIEPGRILTAKVQNFHFKEDIALLHLENPLPYMVEPVRLVHSPEVWGHNFRAYGFPVDTDVGIWASGVLRDRLLNKWIQIEDVKVPGKRVQPGFSGTPVYNEQLKGIVGIVNAADTDAVDKVAFLIPCDVLGDYLPELKTRIIVIRYDDSQILDNISKPDLLQLIQDAFIASQATKDTQRERITSLIEDKQPTLPQVENLFEIITDPKEILSAIFRTTKSQWLAPYEIPYVKGREGVSDVQKEIYNALLAEGGTLLVQSRSGLGKTREIAELAVQLSNRGWIICVAKGGRADKDLEKLHHIPEELREKRIVLIFDDLHRRVSSNHEKKPYIERLESFLEFLDNEMTPGSVRLLATTRTEPFHSDKLNFNPNISPWNRFGVYDLPEFSLKSLKENLIKLAELANVDLKKTDISLMVENCDRTLRTLYENVNRARNNNYILSYENWLPSRGESWEARFLDACGRFKGVEEIYTALHLIREAGLPTRSKYITTLSSNLAGINTQISIDGLVNMGLLGTRHDILDAFSDEQLADSLISKKTRLPNVLDYWDSISNAIVSASDATFDWANDMLTLSMRLYERGKYRDGIAVVDEVLKNETKNAQAFFKRGELKSQTDDIPGAIKDYTQAINCGLENFDVYYNRGMHFAKLENYDAALKDISEAINFEPNDAVLYGMRGSLHFLVEDYTNAVDDFSKSIDLNNTDGETYLGLGMARCSNNDYLKAIEDLEKAIELGTIDSVVYNYLGRAKGGLDDYVGAEKDYSKSIELGNDEISVFYERGLCRLLGDIPGADSDFNIVIKKGRDDAGIFYLRGLARRINRNYIGAESDLSESIKKGFNNDAVHIARGRTRLLLDDPEGAESDYLKALEIGSDDPETLVGLGRARLSMDNLIAEDDFSLAIERGVDTPDVYFYRGVTRSRKGDNDNAESDFTEAIKRNFLPSVVYYARGRARANGTKYNEAIEDYNEFIKRSSDMLDDAYYYRGLAKGSIEDHAGKVEDISIAINNGRTDSETYFQRGLSYVLLLENEKAESDFTTAIEKGYDGSVVYILRGHLLFTKRDYKGAILDYRAVIERGEESVDVYNRLAVALRIVKRWHEAIDVINKLISIDPKNFQYWVGLAACARKVNDEISYREAIEKAEKYLDKSELYGTSCYYSVIGEKDKAYEYLKQAFDEQPDLAEWAQDDPDFEILWQDPHFQALVNK